MRRYSIHTDPSATWTLIFEEKIGKWHVEKLGSDSERTRFTLDEFEGSDSGKRLQDKLAAALREVQDDV